MQKRYVVELTHEQRERCRELVRSGVAHARSIQHAHIPLQADAGPEGPGRTDQTISEALAVTTVTVARIRKVMVTEGLEAALSHYRGPNRDCTWKPLPKPDDFDPIGRWRKTWCKNRLARFLSIAGREMQELRYCD